MKKLLMGIALLPIFSLLSCQQSKNNRLEDINSLSDINSDSAWRLLNTIPNIERLNRADRAAYNLLLFKVKDKNKILFDHDSLLDYSLTYYQQKGDLLKQAMCWFYKGRVFYKKSRFQEAALYYKRAEKEASIISDIYSLSLIYNHLGHVNFQQNLFEEALLYYIIINHWNVVTNRITKVSLLTTLITLQVRIFSKVILIVRHIIIKDQFLIYLKPMLTSKLLLITILVLFIMKREIPQKLNFISSNL